MVVNVKHWRAKCKGRGKGREREREREKEKEEEGDKTARERERDLNGHLFEANKKIFLIMTSSPFVKLNFSAQFVPEQNVLT